MQGHSFRCRRLPPPGSPSRQASPFVLAAGHERSAGDAERCSGPQNANQAGGDEMTTTAENKSSVRRGIAASFLPTAPRGGARCANGRAGAASIAVLVLGTVGFMGCGSSIGASAGERFGVTMAQAEGAALQVGASRVVGSHVNPRAPVQLTSDGRSIAVRFAHPRSAGAVVSLDAESLLPTSPEQRIPAAPAMAQLDGAVRAVLPGGRFIVCWKKGSPEWGYRMLAQA